MERNQNERNLYMQAYLQDPEKKERHKKAVYKSHAKKFILELATAEEMNELIRAFNYRDRYR